MEKLSVLVCFFHYENLNFIDFLFEFHVLFSCGLSRKFLYGFPCIKEVLIVRSLSFSFGRFIENVTENSFYFYTYNFVININPFFGNY